MRTKCHPSDKLKQAAGSAQCIGLPRFIYTEYQTRRIAHVRSAPALSNFAFERPRDGSRYLRRVPAPLA